MKDQPEALRLADYMDDPLNDPNDVADAISAELRRLHAENERLTIERDEARRTARQVHEMGTRVVAQRDALLEALRTLLSYAFTLEMRLLDADGEHRAMQQARAAIAKAVEGESNG